MKRKNENTKKTINPEKIDIILDEKKSNTYWITYDEYIKHRFETDTETINDIKKGEKAYFFECAYMYYDIKEQEQKLASLINSDTFYNKEQMDTCWCKNKLKDYEKILNPSIKNKLPKKYRPYKDNFKQYPNRILCQYLNDIWKDNDIKYLGAYNAIFDYKAIYNNFKETKTSIRLLKKLDIVDTRLICIRMLYDIPQELEKYKHFCKDNLFYTDKHNCSTTVLSFGCYFWGVDYVEEHIALFDTIDEDKIVAEVYKRYKKYHKELKIEVNNTSGVGITYKPLNIDNIM
jgi:hypothetical protein